MDITTILLLYIAGAFTVMILMIKLVKDAPPGFQNDDGYFSYEDLWKKEQEKNQKLSDKYLENIKNWQSEKQMRIDREKEIESLNEVIVAQAEENEKLREQLWGIAK